MNLASKKRREGGGSLSRFVSKHIWSDLPEGACGNALKIWLCEKRRYHRHGMTSCRSKAAERLNCEVAGGVTGIVKEVGQGGHDQVRLKVQVTQRVGCTLSVEVVRMLEVM